MCAQNDGVMENMGEEQQPVYFTEHQKRENTTKSDTRASNSLREIVKRRSEKSGAKRKK